MATGTTYQKQESVKSRFSSLDLKSNYALVFSARKGLKTAIFYQFAETIKMSEKTLSGILNLSPRKINNYKELKKLLEPSYAEHLLKLIALFEKGEEVFGNIDEFNYWLKKPFWNAHETPFSWIITPGGVDLLIEELDKLAQGYPS